jgi:hypothetical protein
MTSFDCPSHWLAHVVAFNLFLFYPLHDFMFMDEEITCTLFWMTLVNNHIIGVSGYAQRDNIKLQTKMRL